jgi:hypothetical protein
MNLKNKTSLLLVSVFFCTISVFSQNEEFLFSPKGIAEIHITLSNNKTIGDIKNEKQNTDYAGKLDAEMVIVNSELSTYEDSDLYTGKIKIDGRGNTSWGAPKKPYSIDLVTDDGSENPSVLLGMPSDDEWCLLGLWIDASLIRNSLAMYLAQQMGGIQWVPHMQYVEVWINNDYIGLYCLSEKIRRGDDRIDVKKLTTDPQDQLEPRISGGYILEASGDNDKNKPIEIATHVSTPKGVNFVFKYPKAKNVTPEQRAWIKEYLKNFENMLWGDEFTDPDIGYQNYINEASFIDWTILHELSKSADCQFHASVFVHKDRNGKLNMSAPWDFDLGFGYYWNTEDKATSRKDVGDGVRGNTNRWPGRLAQDPLYAERYKERFDALLPLFEQIPEILKANCDQLEAAGVLDRDHAKWPGILQDYTKETEQTRPASYKDQIRYVSEWIESRTAWCYMRLGATSAEKAERLKKTRPAIRVMDFGAWDRGEDFKVKVMEGYSYVWSDMNGVVRSSNLRWIDQDGIYTVQIKDQAGNLSLPSKPLIRGTFESIQTPENAMELTYSNPVKDILILNYTTNKSFNLKIQLLDMKGVLMKGKTVPATSGNNQTQIETSGLESGIYILRLTTDSGTISKKIIVIK